MYESVDEEHIAGHEAYERRLVGIRFGIDGLAGLDYATRLHIHIYA